MDSLDVGKTCVRRWYVFGPLLVLGLLLGYHYAQTQPTHYTVTGQFSFIYRPQSGSTSLSAPSPLQLNPLSTDVLESAISSDLTSNAVHQQVLAAGGKAPYTVTTPRNEPVTVQAGSDNQKEAYLTVEAVLKLVPEQAKIVQGRAGAPPVSQYTSFVVAAPKAEPDASTSKDKIMIAFGAVGLLAGAALSVLVDGALRRRRRSAEVSRSALWSADVTEGNRSLPRLDIEEQLQASVTDATSDGH